MAAAGNESARDVNPAFEVAASLPAAAEGILSVAAVEPKAAGLDVASFSNTLVEISAPGVNIQSAKAGGGLTSMRGTSMATPHVAGAALLWWQKLRSLPLNANANTVIAKLRATARFEVLVPNVDPADCGVGLVTVPT